MLVGSGARSGRRHAFTLIELVVTIVVVALLAGIAWTGFRAAILHSHDTKALAAVDAIGSGVGVLGALGGGTDFDYSEPSVRQAVASPSGLVNPGGKTSGRYSEYGWAMGTDPVTKTARSMVVMRSESGACAACSAFVADDGLVFWCVCPPSAGGRTLPAIRTVTAAAGRSLDAHTLRVDAALAATPGRGPHRGQ